MCTVRDFCSFYNLLHSFCESSILKTLHNPVKWYCWKQAQPAPEVPAGMACSSLLLELHGHLREAAARAQPEVLQRSTTHPQHGALGTTLVLNM